MEMRACVMWRSLSAYGGAGVVSVECRSPLHERVCVLLAGHGELSEQFGQADVWLLEDGGSVGDE